MAMTKRERLAAAVAGHDVDRAPVALWRHFQGDDTDPEQLARSAAAFQHHYDWDFLKLTPSSHYSVHEWGTRVAYRGHPHGTSEYVSFAVASPAELRTLPPQSPHHGALGDQLACIRRLRELVGPDVPILETVFSPHDQMRHLVPPGLDMVYLRSHPNDVAVALERITETTVAFIRAAFEAGADGIFYATQYATSLRLSPSEYQEHCRPFDLRILEAAADASFNLMHLHGNHTYFDLVADYPVHALNWHDRETGPSLAEGMQRFPGLVVGGLSQTDMVEGSPAHVQTIARQALAETGGRRVALSTGCVVPTVVPWGTMRALRAAVENVL